MELSLYVVKEHLEKEFSWAVNIWRKSACFGA